MAAEHASAGLPPPAPSWRRDLAWLAVAFALLLVWDASPLDMTLAGWFGDASGFAWRDRMLTAVLVHQGGRILSAMLVGFTLVTCLRPFGPWRDLERIERWWWFAVTTTCLLVIPQIKHHSATSCPWDLQAFGGVAQHVSHWQGLLARGGGDGGPGHCFPSGHASGGFAFLAIGWVLRQRAPRIARRITIAIVALGLVFGIGQMARGAHFASHTLYTAWICAAITIVSWHAMQRLRERTQPAAVMASPAG